MNTRLLLGCLAVVVVLGAGVFRAVAQQSAETPPPVAPAEPTRAESGRGTPGWGYTGPMYPSLPHTHPGEEARFLMEAIASPGNGRAYCYLFDTHLGVMHIIDKDGQVKTVPVKMEKE